MSRHEESGSELICDVAHGRRYAKRRSVTMLTLACLDSYSIFSHKFRSLFALKIMSNSDSSSNSDSEDSQNDPEWNYIPEFAMEDEDRGEMCEECVEAFRELRHYLTRSIPSHRYGICATGNPYLDFSLTLRRCR